MTRLIAGPLPPRSHPEQRLCLQFGGRGCFARLQLIADLKNWRQKGRYIGLSIAGLTSRAVVESLRTTVDSMSPVQNMRNGEVLSQVLALGALARALLAEHDDSQFGEHTGAQSPKGCRTAPGRRRR
jgi:hypothetical protein